MLKKRAAPTGYHNCRQPDKIVDARHNDLISGLVMADGLPRWRVEYHDGMMPVVPQLGGPIPAMPPEIGRRTPLSLWHYLFEFHNGRIFEQWLGMNYLFIVPLGGLALLLLLLTGIYDWFYRRL